jgi:hypothetical protein
MSSETMGPERRQCDNDDCERIHEFCPLCGEKTASHAHFEDSGDSTATLPESAADRFCVEWNDDDLWIYWHD